MNEENETVYCLKYALTSGIIKITGYARDNGRFMRKDTGWYQSLGQNEWARTGEDAIKKAEILRERKLVSLTKQVKKLEEMTFEVP